MISLEEIAVMGVTEFPHLECSICMCRPAGLGGMPM
jgi:hypothetical protein